MFFDHDGPKHRRRIRRLYTGVVTGEPYGDRVKPLPKGLDATEVQKRDIVISRHCRWLFVDALAVEYHQLVVAGVLQQNLNRMLDHLHGTHAGGEYDWLAGLCHGPQEFVVGCRWRADLVARHTGLFNHLYSPKAPRCRKRHD